MAKRSLRHPLRYEQDRPGCMWGFISMFDFRHGQTPKRLLSDRRRGNKPTVGSGYPKNKLNMLTNLEEPPCQSSDDGEEIETIRIDSMRTSVKELMEEEMFIEEGSKKPTFSKLELQNLNSKNGGHLRSKSCDLQVSEEKSSKKLDIQHLIEDLDKNSNEESSKFEEKLSSSLKALVDLKEHGRTHFSEESLDLVKALGLDKELFLKYLEDPDSVLANRINESEKTHELVSGSDKFIGQKRRNFFRRKSKSQDTTTTTSKSNEEIQSSRRIVILKPESPERDGFRNEKNGSHFSLSGIKKKLKNAMGKEKQEKEGELESVGWSSPNRDHFYTEVFAKRSLIVKKRENNLKLKKSEKSETNDDSGERVSNIYIEAKKHLSEMMRNGDEDKELSSGQIPKTLGRILALPDYNFSPSCSPRDREESFVTAKMRFSPRSDFRIENDSESGLRSSGSSPEEKKHPQESNSEETLPFAEDEIISEGAAECAKTSTSEPKEKGLLNISDEPNSPLVTGDGQACDPAEVYDEETPSQCMKLDSFEEDQLSSPPLASPSSCSVAVYDSENTLDKTERPSPISVLEPLFGEDDISPSSTIIRPVDSVQPHKINFEEPTSSTNDQVISIRNSMEEEESAFEYVEAVLLGSDLNWDDFLLRWLSSDQILDPSLFDEVGLFSSRPCHDQKLLFDCTNEVLRRVCDRYFGCFSGVLNVSTKIRPVPKGIDLIREIWEGVESFLLQPPPPPPPSSLEQLVQKDMAKPRWWMDLRFDTELIVIEMGDIVFEELMEDIILSFDYL